MESLDITQLTVKYFEMEREIDKMNIKKQEVWKSNLVEWRIQRLGDKSPCKIQELKER